MGCGPSSTKHVDEQNAPGEPGNDQKVDNQHAASGDQSKPKEAPATENTNDKPKEQQGSSGSKVPSSSHLVNMDLVSLEKKPDFGDSESLTAKYVTPQVWDQVKDKTTKGGFAFDLVINSAYANRDSGIGSYAPEPEAYETFAPFFDKVIEEYHGFTPNDNHTSCMEPSKLKGDNPDPDNEFIVSTRIRVGRNLDGAPLAPGISKEQRLDVERRITEVLNSFEGELAGEYYSLNGMDEETRQKLVDDHFLFKKGDRFLEAAGANRDWPEGRGIFHSADKKFLVWVNEEDELRIISMQMGGNVREVFERLSKAVNILEGKLKFAHSDHLGYLTSCPTNLGTAMRASVHIKIPHVSKQDNFKDWCKEHQLSIRGIHGEHSESEGGVYDISNKRRLGISEVDCVQTMLDGVAALIAWEKDLQEKANKPEENAEDSKEENAEESKVEENNEVEQPEEETKEEDKPAEETAEESEPKEETPEENKDNHAAEETKEDQPADEEKPAEEESKPEENEDESKPEEEDKEDQAAEENAEASNAEESKEEE